MLPQEEAELIVGELFSIFGTGGLTDRDAPWVDGRDAIQEMENNSFPGWKEVEWAGYHVKYLVQEICKENPGWNINPYDLGKRHLVKGNFLWDTRINNFEKEDVILGDIDEYNEIINQNNGIGIIVLDSYMVIDKIGDFRRWHEEFKGELSEYSKRGLREGKKEQPRKIAYQIVRSFTYFFKPGDLQLGVKENWAEDKFQRTMKNFDDARRKPKYQIRKRLVPKENLLEVKNFNEDPIEFAEDYPEYS